MFLCVGSLIFLSFVFFRQRRPMASFPNRCQAQQFFLFSPERLIAEPGLPDQATGDPARLPEIIHSPKIPEMI